MINKKGKGEVRIHAQLGANVRAHELKTVRALLAAGYTVEFLAEKDIKNVKSPDVLMNGRKWEIKSPKTNKLSSIERNLKRAYRQSTNIIFDSQRMGRLPDESIQKELIKQFKLTKKVRNIIFINRKRNVIDIGKMLW